ncbi:hypothetical protein [Dysgonomonas sp. 511]|uniref:hypothetical protein n=1 Tax=Dysgonomonas sp. 511 TaxID=2302930 RepID=UPI0013D35F97|nr:hypothetical protein [Dysgonomonas sp. 511]NDV78411.1 hypothetical protein [Dysgonomonas sp. 511]
MTKICKLLLSVLSACILSACSGSSSPEDVAVDTVTYIFEGKFEKAIENVHIPSDLKTEEEIRNFKLSGMKVVMENMTDDYGYFARVNKKIKENGGFKKVKAIPYDDSRFVYYTNWYGDDDEVIKGALVKLVVVCKNGEEIEMDTQSLRMDNGKWKIK